MADADALHEAVAKVINALKQAEIGADEASTRFTQLGREVNMSDDDVKHYSFQFAGCRSGNISLWSRMFYPLIQAVPDKNEAFYNTYDNYFPQDKDGSDPETCLQRLAINFGAKDDKEANKIRERLLNTFLRITEAGTDVFFLFGPAGELYEFDPEKSELPHRLRKVPPDMIILDLES